MGGPAPVRGNRTAQPRRLSPRPRSLLALARGAPASRRPPLHNPSRTTPRIDRQVDIFAVRQWAGNVADLDFACAIRAAPLFLLVAMHLPEVEALSKDNAFAKKVPVGAKSKCAFYRVWVRRTARLATSQPLPLIPWSRPLNPLCLAGRPEQRADARACLSAWSSASSS